MRKKFFMFSIFMLSVILLLSFTVPSINANAATNKNFEDNGTPNELGKK